MEQGDGAGPEWWSISQAVVWLVARDLERVENTAITDDLYRLYVPVNHDVPDMPISKDEAAPALMAKWRAGAFEIHGRSANGERVIVPRPRLPVGEVGLTTINGSLSIWVKELPVPSWDTPHWSHLWVKPAQIIACWKPKVAAPTTVETEETAKPAERKAPPVNRMAAREETAALVMELYGPIDRIDLNISAPAIARRLIAEKQHAASVDTIRRILGRKEG